MPAFGIIAKSGRKIRARNTTLGQQQIDVLLDIGSPPPRRDGTPAKPRRRIIRLTTRDGEQKKRRDQRADHPADLPECEFVLQGADCQRHEYRGRTTTRRMPEGKDRALRKPGACPPASACGLRYLSLLYGRHRPHGAVPTYKQAAPCPAAPDSGETRPAPKPRQGICYEQNDIDEKYLGARICCLVVKNADQNPEHDYLTEMNGPNAPGTRVPKVVHSSLVSACPVAGAGRARGRR